MKIYWFFFGFLGILFLTGIILRLVFPSKAGLSELKPEHKEWLDKFNQKVPSNLNLDSTFIFPYSSNLLQSRKQIWSNLQKGILFEDQEILINWLTPFSNLDKYAVEKVENGDDVIWHLGKRKVLDGYEGIVLVNQWFSPNINPFSEVTIELGNDGYGEKEFNLLQDKLENVFGLPNEINIDKSGSFVTGEISWRKDHAQISLMGIHRHAYHYSLKIGLIDNVNYEIFK